jgi:hypothetical protein
MTAAAEGRFVCDERGAKAPLYPYSPDYTTSEFDLAIPTRRPPLSIIAAANRFRGPSDSTPGQPFVSGIMHLQFINGNYGDYKNIVLATRWRATYA